MVCGVPLLKIILSMKNGMVEFKDAGGGVPPYQYFIVVGLPLKKIFFSLEKALVEFITINQ